MTSLHSPRLLATAALLASVGAAQAMSNDTAPANWRFDSTTTFRGTNFDGVARLSFDSDGDLSNGYYVCSGTLLAGGRHVLTAAHCADNFNVMKVEFGVNNDVATATYGVAQAYVHSGWTGALSMGNDIAILALNAPVTDIQGFNLHTGSALGQSVLMMGYGTTAVGNSTTAPNWADWGHGHWGVNRFDATGQQFLDAADAMGLPGLGTWSNTDGEEYVADYDNGLALRNTLGRITGLTSDTGGLIESLITGGDSGGGDFFWSGTEWLLTGVHSWGWQFCGGRLVPSCDRSSANSGSWGDLMGSTAVYSHAAWVDSITDVPEPGTWALAALGLLAAGGSTLRRRRDTMA